MILKHLPSFNVAVSRLLRTDCTHTPAVVEFCHKFQIADDLEALPGINLHRVADSKTRDVWSARASQEIRVILRKRGPAWYAAYVGHHEDAYKWAERNEIELPRTKAALGGELDEIDLFLAGPGGGEALPVPPAAAVPHLDGPKLFDPFDDASLAELGVPHVMIAMLRQIVTIEEFIEKAYSALPEGLGDRLFAALTGEFATVAEGLVTAGAEPDGSEISTPVRTPEVGEVITVLAEHPDSAWAALPDAQQQALAQGEFKGAVLVKGPAGSGKTAVALHRARYLASQGHQVLLTTFTRALRAFLWTSLRTLCTDEELSRVQVRTVDYMAKKLSGYEDSLFDEEFLKHDDFQRVCDEATRRLDKREAKHDFTAVVVDETQDLDPPRLAFVQTLSRKCRKRLMLLGDMEQRIYSFPCDLEDMGFEFGNRVFELDTVYRSTLEITQLGRAILASAGQDGGGRLPFAATAYASGAAPELRAFASDEDEILWSVVRALLLLQDGIQPGDIGVLTHKWQRRDTLRSAFDAVGLPYTSGLRVMTMHAAKGLEFRAVLVLDVSEDKLPNPWAAQHEKERGTYGDWLERQRNLLHVAVTRASDLVCLAWVGQASPFLANALEQTPPRQSIVEDAWSQLAFDASGLTNDPAGLMSSSRGRLMNGSELIEALRGYVGPLTKEER